MAQDTDSSPLLKNLGDWLFLARKRQGLTQQELASRTRIAQPRLSGMEKGRILPTLLQLLRLAQALQVPLQWFLNGSTVPGSEVTDMAMELYRLGVVDLHIPNAVVPGAFRPSEQVIASAVSGNQPDPRIIEAIPAVLAWMRWSHLVLRTYSQRQDPRAGIRLAWLADIVLSVHGSGGFPGGCPQRRELETFVRWWAKHPAQRTDDLGRPALTVDLPPVWQRWKITYDVPVTAFVERARHLQSYRDQKRPNQGFAARANDD